MKNKYNINDEVFWSDPDEDKSSGYYKVIDVINNNCEEHNVYMISNELSEAEVFEHELQ